MELRTAVVTGASGGIGFEICKRLSSLGFKVIGITRKPENELQTKFQDLENQNLRHECYRADISVSPELQAVADQLAEKKVKINLLVNCAGFSRAIPHKNLSALTDDFFDEILKVNLRSVYATIREFYSLVDLNDSLIINISSAAAIRTGGSNLAYAAAKSGLESLTRNLALSLAPTRVISICPGAVDTGFIKKLPPEHISALERSTPLKRIATVKDVADSVEACLNLKFVTGTSILLDGGKLL
jgi:3-oxoacyl-[acyl-carrier protein] reductase